MYVTGSARRGERRLAPGGEMTLDGEVALGDSRDREERGDFTTAWRRELESTGFVGESFEDGVAGFQTSAPVMSSDLDSPA